MEELPDLDSRTIKLLENGGILSVEDLVEKSFEELIEIDGIGEKKAQKILDIIADNVDFEEDEETSETEEKTNDLAGDIDEDINKSNIDNEDKAKISTDDSDNVIESEKS